jgi:hypothetical protein
MLEGFAGALALVWHPFYLLMLFCGVMVGIVIGILPGVGGTVAMAIVLPFVFKLGEPSAALALIIGAGAVCVTSDSREQWPVRPQSWKGIPWPRKGWRVWPSGLPSLLP